MDWRLAGALLLAALLAGCSDAATDPPTRTARDDMNNLHLYVSNQSFDQPTADLKVTVDGETGFDGKADVEGQHNWTLREIGLEPGTHRIEALERDTDTRASQDFTLPAGEERWVVVNYWNPYSEGEGPGFTIEVHEEQVYFA